MHSTLSQGRESCQARGRIGQKEAPRTSRTMWKEGRQPEVLRGVHQRALAGITIFNLCEQDGIYASREGPVLTNLLAHLVMQTAGHREALEEVSKTLSEGSRVGGVPMWTPATESTSTSTLGAGKLKSFSFKSSPTDWLAEFVRFFHHPGQLTDIGELNQTIYIPACWLKPWYFETFLQHINLDTNFCMVLL